jgi:hypothetical protein
MSWRADTCVYVDTAAFGDASQGRRDGVGLHREHRPHPIACGCAFNHALHCVPNTETILLLLFPRLFPCPLISPISQSFKSSREIFTHPFLSCTRAHQSRTARTARRSRSWEFCIACAQLPSSFSLGDLANQATPPSCPNLRRTATVHCQPQWEYGTSSASSFCLIPAAGRVLLTSTPPLELRTAPLRRQSIFLLGSVLCTRVHPSDRTLDTPRRPIRHVVLPGTAVPRQQLRRAPAATTIWRASATGISATTAVWRPVSLHWDEAARADADEPDHHSRVTDTSSRRARNRRTTTTTMADSNTASRRPRRSSMATTRWVEGTRRRGAEPGADMHA